MNHRQEGADNVVSMEKLRRSRRRRNRRVSQVPEATVRERSPRTGRASLASASARTANPEQDRTRTLVILSVLALVMVVLLAAIVLYSGLMDIAAIQVVGVKPEEQDSVLARAELRVGMNIFSFTEEGVQERIEKDPTLIFVGVDRILPNQVVLTVEKRKPTLSIKHLGSFLELDQEYVILSIEPEDHSLGDYPVVQGVTIGTTEAGKAVDFQDDLQEYALRTVMDELKKTGAIQYVQSLNFLNLSEIIAIADNGIQVDLGNVSDMHVKANWIVHMIPQLVSEGRHGGTLYVSGGRNASYSPEVKPQETPVPTETTPEATPAPEENPSAEP